MLGTNIFVPKTRNRTVLETETDALTTLTWSISIIFYFTFRMQLFSGTMKNHTEKGMKELYMPAVQFCMVRNGVCTLVVYSYVLLFSKFYLFRFEDIKSFSIKLSTILQCFSVANKWFREIGHELHRKCDRDFKNTL